MMDRRRFIRQLSGGSTNVRNVLLWAAIIVVGIIVIKSDSLSNPGSLISIFKIVGIVLLGLVIISSLLLVIQLGVKKLLQQLPSGIKNWYFAYREIIQFVLSICVIGFLIYYSIREEKYFHLAISLIPLIYSFFKKKEGAKQSN